MDVQAQPLDARRLEGFKYFRLIDDLLAGLRDVGTKRDKAGNRKLFCDQYVTLLLLYFFNPTIATLRGALKFSTLEKVQRMCGIRPTSLGSFSEAAKVFDPAAVEPIIAHLAERARMSPGSIPPAQQAALAGLVAVDGSLLKAVSRMAWALWQDAQHRAVKLHVAFGVFEQAPLEVSITHGNGPERDELRRFAKPGGFYVADRGYANNAMFREFDAIGVRFLIRVQENTTFEVLQECSLSDADREAGVVRDVLVRRLGTEKHNPLLEQPLRIVEVHGREPGEVWILATNARELPADLVGTAYRYRWQVELFFRWLKCVLGCRHLVSQSEQGVTLQVYAAIIATLLIGLWTGGKPTKRTYEMICHYMSGWATLEEVERHLQQDRAKRPPPSKL